MYVAFHGNKAIRNVCPGNAGNEKRDVDSNKKKMTFEIFS